MKIALEMISPGLCGGAIANEQAEIRPTSVRGMLRWWFRVLGGFKSLQADGMTLREQEDLIFGVARGTDCRAGKLQLRTKVINKPKIEVLSFDYQKFPAGSDYFLFPMRGTDGERAVFLSSLPQFELYLRWFGEHRYQEDITALGYVYGYLGSLGMRSRRAMGALAFAEQKQQIPPFQEVIARFAAPESISLRELPSRNQEGPITTLARWLRFWRAYCFGKGKRNDRSPGYELAKTDHDVGYNLPNSGSVTYRPALGLPIIQWFGGKSANVQGNNYRSCHWEYDRDSNKTRFASPVILRPYRSQKNVKKAIVIFVDKYAWPAGKEVILKYKGRPSIQQNKQVSNELYEKMKNDRALRPFIPD